MSGSPVRLAVIGANHIVMRGIEALASDHHDRVRLVPGPRLDGPPGAVGPPGLPGPEPDVVLYDAFSLGDLRDGETHEFDLLVKESSAAVVVLARDLRPDLAARALARGADGCVSLEADAEEIIATVEAAAAGELAGDFAPGAGVGTAIRLGEAEGLSAREVEILGLITQGLHNTEIAERCFLSINSVKTYIRHAYRKIGVRDRSQAVVWCLQAGFAPPDR
jgi:DNA-binding NarL/FixJ family response regulator